MQAAARGRRPRPPCDARALARGPPPRVASPCGLPYQFQMPAMLRCRLPGMPTSSMRLGSSLMLSFTVLVVCAAAAPAAPRQVEWDGVASPAGLLEEGHSGALKQPPEPARPTLLARAS